VDAVPVLGGWQDESPVVSEGDKRGACVVSTSKATTVGGERSSGSQAAPIGVRATLRQALLREVNERIEQLDQEWSISGTVSLLCECGNIGCFERVEISAADYDAVRRFPTRFLVKPGHLAREGDRVIGETANCVIVEKTGPSATDAIRLDPRRRASRRNGDAEQ